VVRDVKLRGDGKEYHQIDVSACVYEGCRDDGARGVTMIERMLFIDGHPWY
jgi:hypothetical protein